MNKLLEIINKDIENIFELGIDPQEKAYICTRCINSCFNILDNILTKKDVKHTITKKLLVIYSYLINSRDINIYDVILEDIYKNIKLINPDYVIKFHQKCLEQNQNIEYHLNMISFYKKTAENTNNLYNYYFQAENYYNCLKLLNYDDPDYFYKKMVLLNNICDFDLLHMNISKIIDFSKNNLASPYLLICMGLGNTIMNNCVKRYVKNIQTKITDDNSIDYKNQNKRDKVKICLLIESKKYHIENFISKNFEYNIVDFGITRSFENKFNDNVSYMHVDINNSNIYKFLVSDNYDLMLNFCSMHNSKVFKLIAKRIARYQINMNDYLGSFNSNIFDYVMIGKQYNQINSNYNYAEKKIIIDCPFLLNIDYSKDFNFIIKNNYDYIIQLINDKIDENNISNFLVDYIYRIIKFNIRNINNGIYNKELLIERQIKNILNKSDINEENYDMFQENYIKIRNIKKGLINKKNLLNIYNSIILPKTKQKNYFRFCVLSGSKKISKKDILIYNYILSKTNKTVLYILETVCFENRDMILKNFDDSLRNRIYFIPFIEPQLNIYRFMYFDCVLDTLNFNIKSIIYDLLRCNIPILTMEGTNLYSTITASILKTLNLKEVICLSTNDYINKAIKIANQLDYYKQIKHKFNNSGICKFYKNDSIERILIKFIEEI
tara:strand:- start:232 stop:2229 length:1998 start_codon:yes stop_codon:yes gene_type:complete